MLISEQLHTILRTIQNQCTNGEQMDTISYLLTDSVNVTDFLIVDKGKDDDTIKFFNNKVSKNDLIYTLTNPTIVGLEHEIYQVALNKIKDDAGDLAKYNIIKSKINQSGNLRSKFKIISEYLATGTYEKDYKIIHLSSVDSPIPFDILQADSISNTGLRPVFDDDLLEGISIKPSEIKFGRFLTKVLTEIKKRNMYLNFSAKDIEKFVNLYKAHNSFSRNAFDYFKIVEGDEITKWYHSSTYANGSGTLNNSCMRLDKCQEYFDIYTNPDNKVKMLILTNGENKLIGRCLLWETEQGKYMDRIYSNDYILNLFKKWAEDNEYKNTHYNGTQCSKQLTTKIKVDMNKQFPYLDSFRFMAFDENDKGNTATLYTQEIGKRFFLLNETNGSFQLRN